jgi:hypothetical protein
LQISQADHARPESRQAMTDTGGMIPIGDEQAKAAQEALKTARAAGSYFAEVLGTVPHDVVGLLGGDWLRVKRAENAARIAQSRRCRCGSVMA